MTKIALIFLGLSTQIFFAQANRFIYQVTMKTDSTNRNDIKTETAYLDATPENLFSTGKKDCSVIRCLQE